MYDSIACASDCAAGKSSMNTEYIAKISKRRTELRVPQLLSSAMPNPGDSRKLPYIEAEARVRRRNS